MPGLVTYTWLKTSAYVRRDACTAMHIAISVQLRTDTCAGMRIDMFVARWVHMCMYMPTDMCIGRRAAIHLCTNMCMDTCGYVHRHAQIDVRTIVPLRI